MVKATADDPTTQPTRRERLRAETTREITAIALHQLATDGPGAISLRGIAREMGMTPRAIYSYFPTRDDLITELVGEQARSMADSLEAAADAVPADDPPARILAWGLALRDWALAHPQGFRLVYGDPVPGYQQPPDGPLQKHARRMCLGLNRIVTQACPTAPAVEDFTWSQFIPCYAEEVRTEITDSPTIAALTVRVWGRMHGLVTLELHRHLCGVTTDPESLYRAELTDLTKNLSQ